MSNIVDFLDDANGYVWGLLVKEYNIPDTLKAYRDEALSTFDTNKEASLYLLPVEKKFPVFNAEDISLHYMYLQKVASALTLTQKQQAEHSLKEFIQLSGVSPMITLKEQETVYEKSASAFAVHIPLDGLHPDLQEKYASYHYNGAIALYPLDTPEDVRYANNKFPAGLDDELAFHRSSVARAIVNNLPRHEHLSEKVATYAKPLKKTEAFFDLKTRVDYLPQGEVYRPLMEKVASGSIEDPLKFAMELQSLDKHFQIDRYANLNVIDHSRYAGGLVDDLMPEPVVTIDSIKFNRNHLQKSASGIKSMFPQLKDEHILDPQLFGDFVKNINDPVVESALKVVIRGF